MVANKKAATLIYISLQKKPVYLQISGSAYGKFCRFKLGT